jgi:putative FmdB family regulatory protein
MPTYEYECACGNTFERVLPLARYDEQQWCHCGGAARKIFTKAPFGIVQKECVYDSPVDGRPITSWAQRRDDLARNGCQEYDPMMRQDYDRRLKREDAELDSKIEATVEEEIEKMPSRKKELLAQSIDSGASPTPERSTAPLSLPGLKAEVSLGVN